MNFQFNEDQLLFVEAVRTVLNRECTPTHLRTLEQKGGTHCNDRWQKLVELGLPGIMLSDTRGGMGFSTIDFVLIAEECGYVALPENLVELAGVVLPVLLDQGAVDSVLSGKRTAVLSHPANPYVVNVQDADFIAFVNGTSFHFVDAENIERTEVPSVDPLRKLSQLTNINHETTPMTPQEDASLIFENGALFSAAQLIGLARAMLDMSVQYAKDRSQFGQPIGGFQAVKHQLADVRTQIEFAAPVVYKAAADLSNKQGGVSLIVSQAKLGATKAALQAAKTAIQIHGAMGYTYEVDLHFWMKRAWALAGQWGSEHFHEARVASYLFDDSSDLGTHRTFQ